MKQLYKQNKTENEVAKEMGYVTSEKNRQPGYKQIKNLSGKTRLLRKLGQRLVNGDPNLFHAPRQFAFRIRLEILLHLFQ